MKAIKTGAVVNVKKCRWLFINKMVCLSDYVGVIESIKPNHSNVHKYCIRLNDAGDLLYTNNKKGTGDYLFSIQTT